MGTTLWPTSAAMSCQPVSPLSPPQASPPSGPLPPADSLRLQPAITCQPLPQARSCRALG